MSLEINYSSQPVASSHDKPSIFLAGPTPRDLETQSWRPDAIEILRGLGYAGLIYAPEIEIPDADHDYTEQVDWEWAALEVAKTIAFWVPRKIDPTKSDLGMPAFTTNTEFGFWLAKNPDKVFYGRPDWAKKVGYLDKLYEHTTGRTALKDLGALMIVAAEHSSSADS
jgi:hypothetical protein